MVQRYFVKKDQWDNQTVVIQGDDVHHIGRVMRMEPGDNIICIRSDQVIAECRITDISNDEVTCHIESWIREDRELPVFVTIVQSLGKGDKLEQVIQKGTELGAYRFIPFKADRSISKWDDKKAVKKLQRLQKIAKEASEQSQRAHIPVIENASTIKEIVAMSETFNAKVFAYENEAKTAEFHSLASHLETINAGDQVLVVIGPEGGFSEREVNTLYDHGFQSFRLGRRILRMETAPLYYLSSVSYQFEELR